MKSKLYLLFILCVSMFFVACSDNTETFDERWKNENEAQFALITADSRFTKLESLTGNGHIMYRVLESGDENGRFPFFTERVRVNYTGWFKNDWSREDYFINDRGHRVTNKIIFDSTFDDRGNARPIGFNVNGLIPGFSDALQRMRPGDKWEVWIPWHLAYGQRGGGSNIRGFTTLVFEIELIEVLPPR
jgi:peptidylprolyl isomerase/FKBP-type peptidyl-prolyl cis-trans isomerase FklB